MAIANAAEPGAAGRHSLNLVAIANAAEPGAAGRHSLNLVAIANAAEPGAAGRHSSNLVGRARGLSCQAGAGLAWRRCGREAGEEEPGN